MQQDHLFFNCFKKRDNFGYNVDKNESFLNIFGMKHFVRKNKLKIKKARLSIFYKIIDLLNFWSIKKDLHKYVIFIKLNFIKYLELLCFCQYS